MATANGAATTVGFACAFLNEELSLSRIWTPLACLPLTQLPMVFSVLLKAYSKVIVAVVVEVEWISNIGLLSDGLQRDSVSQVQISDFMYVFRLFST